MATYSGLLSPHFARLNDTGGIVNASGTPMLSVGSQVAISNKGSSGSVGSAASTVDLAGVLVFSQTTANIALTLPTPTTASNVTTLILVNSGSAALRLTGAASGSDTMSLPAGQIGAMFWNGSLWKTDLSVSAPLAAVGTADDGPLIKAMVDAGARLLPAMNYLVTAEYTMAGDDTRFEVAPGGSIKLTGSGKLIFEYAHRIKIVNTNFIGGLSSKQQYSDVTGSVGLLAAFTSPTYDDGAGTDKSGDGLFTHSITSNVLTFSATTRTGQVVRRVLSTFMTLDPAKRYVIQASGEYGGGNGLGHLDIILYDGSNTPLGAVTGVCNASGVHLPGDSDTWYRFITGATKIKLGLNVSLQDYTQRSLTATVDLTKFKIYECVNDASTFSTGAAVEDVGAIAVSGCVSPEISGCTFTMFDRTAVQFVNGCTDAAFKNNTSSYCYGVVSDTGCTRTVVSGNSLDGSFEAASSLRVPCTHLRNHLVGGGASTVDMTVADNLLTGANWPIEIIVASTSKTVITRNKIAGQYCGTSLDGGSNNVFGHNHVSLGYLGGVGVEFVNTTGRASISNNVIEATLTADSYGMTISNTAAVDVSNNTIAAAIGVFDTTSDANIGRATIQNNTISFSFSAVYTQRANTLIARNGHRLVQGYCGFGSVGTPGPVPAAFMVQPPGVRTQKISFIDNYGDSGVGGAWNIRNTPNYQLVGNVIEESGVKSYSFYYSHPAGEICTGLLRNNTINGWAGTGYLAMNWADTAAGGTTTTYDNNWVNGTTFYPNGAVGLTSTRGMPYFVASFNILAIAPGGSWLSPTISIADARLMDKVSVAFKIGRASCRERVSSPV